KVTIAERTDRPLAETDLQNVSRAIPPASLPATAFCRFQKDAFAVRRSRGPIHRDWLRRSSEPSDYRNSPIRSRRKCHPQSSTSRAPWSVDIQKSSLQPRSILATDVSRPAAPVFD